MTGDATERAGSYAKPTCVFTAQPPAAPEFVSRWSKTAPNARLQASARLENHFFPTIVWERAAQRLCGLCAIYRFSSQWIRIAGLIIARTGSTSEHAVACALAPVMMGLVHELWSVIPPQATSGVESGTCSSRTSSPSSCRTLLPAHHPPGSRAGFPGSAIHAS
jgi:hypothetical protein